MCGVLVGGVGSSPQARGALTSWEVMPPPTGLIPASAGSTPPSWLSGMLTGAHPRKRGEHLQPALNKAHKTGSSPQARGALLVPGLLFGVQGLIPASAGSTRTKVTMVEPGRAHPRKRGEHSSLIVWQWKPMGLIPASAGSTCTQRPRPPCSRAHPRKRGEHIATLRPDGGRGGSSPQARGARPLYLSPALFGGLIPASAGSTSRLSGLTGVVGAHPRKRGEHARCI